MKGFVMLILSRRIGEQVCIGQSVVVTVVAARKGQVRLAIEAPAQVAIDRQEVRQRCNRSIATKQGRADHSFQEADSMK
jgi:carbon storage regulator